MTETHLICKRKCHLTLDCIVLMNCTYMRVRLTHPYSFGAKATRHVKEHSDGAAVLCDGSGH